MKIFITGLGTGNPNLITLEAINTAEISDVILFPCSNEKKLTGVAEKILLNFVKPKKFFRIFFPMIKNSNERDKIIFNQIIEIKSELENSKQIFFPVIGDSLLYSTGAYLIDTMKKIFDDVEVNFISGISAHSLAAACAKKFLAMSDEILTIIPGTAKPEKISNALKTSDTIAIYKPSALKNIKEVIKSAESYKKIFRIDYAGIPDKEKIYEGYEALENVNEYLSIIILWR